MKRVTAPAEVAGCRLDVWLGDAVPDLSRARIQALIRDGHITSGGRPVRAHKKVTPGLVIDVEVPPPEPVDLVAEDIPLEILHEDSDIIVINKQAGLVVHPAAGHPDGTLVNALLYHCHDLTGIGGETRPGIVHRLDRDTSGVMVVAKTQQALDALVRQFKAGTVCKEYLALVHGVPSPPAGRVETLIGRSASDRKKMSARPQSGRNAISHYSVRESFSSVALLDVRIETGRTHQIRVHMAHIGNPVLGDPQYGSRKLDREVPPCKRQMLHAARLELDHPRTCCRCTFKAPVPADMQAVLNALRAL